MNITPPYANNVSKDCAALNTFYLAQNITAKQYMVVSASSDDTSVNDVLYAPCRLYRPRVRGLRRPESRHTLSAQLLAGQLRNRQRLRILFSRR